MLNEDFKDMLQCLLDAEAEFLLIGGYALAAHGYPRATKDIDLWVDASSENAPRVAAALRAFGAPSHGIREEDFATPGIVLQLGIPPRRIDLTTKVDGVVFEQCWENRETVEIDGLEVPLLSRKNLIENKKATGRPQDLLDVDVLESPD